MWCRFILRLAAIVGMGNARLLTWNDIDEITRCRSEGKFADFTSVPLNPLSSSEQNGSPPLPACVATCPPAAVALNGDCLAPERPSLPGVRLGFSVMLHCRHGDDCAWLADGRRISEGVALRMAQMLGCVPVADIKGSHIQTSASGDAGLKGIYIARRGEPGFSERRLRGAPGPRQLGENDGVFLYMALRSDTRRVGPKDAVVQQLLKHNATSVARFLGLPFSIFNASLMIGVPNTLNREYQLVLAFSGLPWKHLDFPSQTTNTQTSTPSTTSTITLVQNWAVVKQTTEASSSTGTDAAIVIILSLVVAGICALLYFLRRRYFVADGSDAASTPTFAEDVRKAWISLKAAAKSPRATALDCSGGARHGLSNLVVSVRSSVRVISKVPQASATGSSSGAAEMPRARDTPASDTSAREAGVDDPAMDMPASDAQASGVGQNRFTHVVGKARTSIGKARTSVGERIPPRVSDAVTKTRSSLGDLHSNAVAKAKTSLEATSAKARSSLEAASAKLPQGRSSSRKSTSSAEEPEPNNEDGETDTNIHVPDKLSHNPDLDSFLEQLRSDSRQPSPAETIWNARAPPTPMPPEKPQPCAAQPPPRTAAPAGAAPPMSNQAQPTPKQAQPKATVPANTKDTARPAAKATANIKPLGSTQPEHLAVDAMAVRLRALRTVPLDERKRLYKSLCLLCHPDKNLDNPEEAREVFQYLQDKKAWFLGSAC